MLVVDDQLQYGTELDQAEDQKERKTRCQPNSYLVHEQRVRVHEFRSDEAADLANGAANNQVNTTVLIPQKQQPVSLVKVLQQPRIQPRTQFGA